MCDTRLLRPHGPAGVLTAPCLSPVISHALLPSPHSCCWRNSPRVSSILAISSDVPPASMLPLFFVKWHPDFALGNHTDTVGCSLGDDHSRWDSLHCQRGIQAGLATPCPHAETLGSDSSSLVELICPGIAGNTAEHPAARCPCLSGT